MKVKANLKLSLGGKVFEKGQIITSEKEGLLDEIFLKNLIKCNAAVEEFEELTVTIQLAENMIIDNKICDRKDVLITSQGHADSGINEGRAVLIPWESKTLVRCITRVDSELPGTLILIDNNSVDKLVERNVVEVVE